MAVTREDKDNLTKALADHLATVGAKEWGKVRERFPQFSEATFWRYVARVRNGPPDPEHLTTVIETTRARIEQETKPLKEKAPRKARTVREVKRHLPAAPSPDYLVKSGRDGRVALDFLGRWDQLFRDAEMLRTHSMSEDEKIRNAKTFAVSIRLRSDLLNTALTAMGEVWDLRRMQQFHDAVIKAVEQADPETAARILENLRQVDAELGMTFNAQIV